MSETVIDPHSYLAVVTRRNDNSKVVYTSDFKQIILRAANIKEALDSINSEYNTILLTNLTEFDSQIYSNLGESNFDLVNLSKLILHPDYQINELQRVIISRLLYNVAKELMLAQNKLIK
jgi:hypothetical protein